LKIFFDTSVLVASLVREHPHHTRAMGVVAQALGGSARAYIAAHGVAETYAVLTTLPVTPRIGPETAYRLLKQNVLARFETVAITAREYHRTIAALADAAIVGGATYDAIHAACARKAGVDRIYTFNLSHFVRVAPDLRERLAAP
jgi:predicted nucleic acid-binding protein